MVKQDGMSERSKHIDVKFNFVKRLVRDKLVVCPHIATKQMVADIFTKDLPDEFFGGHSVTVLGRVQECTSTCGIKESVVVEISVVFHTIPLESRKPKI